MSSNEQVYNCDICKDEGWIYYTKKSPYFDIDYEYIKPCKCQIHKENQEKIRQSELSEIYKRCTFANYITSTKEQGEAKQKAVDFYRTCTSDISTAYGMLFYGQSGAGKTHLAISTLNNFLQYGKSGLYVNYLELVRKLSQFAMDYMQYNQEISKCISVEVLLIDDLFKSKSNSDISAAKLNYMMEIINHRYYNKKITIFTTEKSVADLLSIDEALASRIIQMTDNKYVLNMNSIANYRLQGQS